MLLLYVYVNKVNYWLTYCYWLKENCISAWRTETELNLVIVSSRLTLTNQTFDRWVLWNFLSLFPPLHVSINLWSRSIKSQYEEQDDVFVRVSVSNPLEDWFACAVLQDCTEKTEFVPGTLQSKNRFGADSCHLNCNLWSKSEKEQRRRHHVCFWLTTNMGLVW